MRIMGLDLGEKRVGIALSDESQTLATPFEVVRRVSFAQLLMRLEQIVAAQNVVALVIGEPRSLHPVPAQSRVGGNAARPSQKGDTGQSAGRGEAAPHRTYDELGPQARHIAAEAQRIQERLQLPVRLWDERLSTVRAEQLLAERGHRRRGARRQPVDALVAAIILQEYLDTRRKDLTVHG